MNDEAYAIEAAVQQTHWWFAGRRQLLRRLLQGLGPQPSWRILEVGCGTGANLPVLIDSGVQQVVGCDYALLALKHCAVHTRHAALSQSEARALPFASSRFDVLVAADVLEHLDDDEAALAEFARVLKPGGHLLVTVPAFPFMWGPQDIVAQHKRRYLQVDLVGLIARSGLQVHRCFHFNYLLMLPIWLARKVLLASRARLRSENEINTAWLNNVLTRIFAADVVTAVHVRPRWGVSLCLVASKAASR